MKKTLVLVVVAGMLLSLTGTATAQPITIGNFSFEEPCTVKLLNWENVPNWNSDTVATNSGVDTEDSGYVVTDGQWFGFLKNTDPSVYNLTDHTISAGELLILTVDASKAYTTGGNSPLFKMTLYYDNSGSRVPVSSHTFALHGTDDQIIQGEYSITFTADLTPASIGEKIGIELQNTVALPLTSWLFMDNVRLEKSLVSNPVPADHDTFVAVTTNISWTLDPSIDKCDVYFGTDSDVTANPKVIDGVKQTSYNPPSNLDPEMIYFWRVDTYVGGTLYEGDKTKWEFTTAPAGSPQGNTYYVNGTYGDDSDSGTINEPWKTLNKANSTLLAGDTVHIRAGIYTNSINPQNTGSAGQRIVYQNYGNESVCILGDYMIFDARYIANGLYLKDKQYISVTGIDFSKAITESSSHRRRWFHLENVDNILIKDCVFMNGEEDFRYAMSIIYGMSNSVFDGCSWDASNTDVDSDTQHDLLNVMDNIDHNLWTNCYFGNVSHNEVYFSTDYAEYNVFYNTIFSNKWRHAITTRFGPVLLENCVFDNIGERCDECPWFYDRCTANRIPASFYPHALQKSIFRHNVFYNSDIPINLGGQFRDTEYNWIYHNTAYNSLGHDGVNTHRGTLLNAMGGGTTKVQKNSIINNIFAESEHNRQMEAYNYEDAAYDPINNIIAYNIVYDKETNEIRWGRQTGTVQFVENNHDDWIAGTNIVEDPSFTNPENAVFTLNSNSPAINAGRYITLTDGSGTNSETFKCDDVYWVFSGPNPPWNINYPGIQADRIYFQQSDNSWVEKTVVGIDYNTKTITLDAPASWNDNTPVYYKKFNGSAPDLGAYEFAGVACFPISQDGWNLWFVDSEELVEDGGYPAEKSFDGDPDTFWSTDWDINDIPPHEIQIDLDSFYDICGFRYLPRQDSGDGSENGMIKDYGFYVSSDGATWGDAVVSGTFVKDKTEKQVSFDSKLGKYVRLVAINEVEARAWTTMAELNVLAVQPDTDINNDGKVNIEDFATMAAWWDDNGGCVAPDWCEGTDFDMSGTVDMLDFTYFAENWLRQEE